MIFPNTKTRWLITFIPFLDISTTISIILHLSIYLSIYIYHGLIFQQNLDVSPSNPSFAGSFLFRCPHLTSQGIPGRMQLLEAFSRHGLQGLQGIQGLHVRQSWSQRIIRGRYTRYTLVTRTIIIIIIIIIIITLLLLIIIIIIVIIIIVIIIKTLTRGNKHRFKKKDIIAINYIIDNTWHHTKA